MSYANALLQSRYLSNSGRLFFNSDDSLVPKDGNGQEDVYEYEPEGIENAEHKQLCTSSSSSGSEVYKLGGTFKAPPAVPGGEPTNGEEGAGCVALISSGISDQESAFMEASETGGDVFFLTAAHLVPGEIEVGDSLYDAHECTGTSPCAPETQTPPKCKSASECRGGSEPQPGIYGAPPSQTFNGLGNITAEPAAPAAKKKVVKKTVKCHKGFVKNKHGKCVRKPRPKKRGKK